MSDDQTQAAVKAIVRMMVSDNEQAIAAGLDTVRLDVDEVVAEPNPADYVAPNYLKKTAPHLAPVFEELLGELCKLNARFVGERTLDAEATLKLTGEHERLEEMFRRWCVDYFKIRGSLDRLGPSNENDPLRLYLDCFEEFEQLLGNRTTQPGTINGNVLALSRRYMFSSFAAQVLDPDLKSYAKTGRDRYASAAIREEAKDFVHGYHREVAEFVRFLEQIADNLPVDYEPDESPDWLTEIETKVAQHAEDLAFLYYVLCALHIDGTDKQQLVPGLWGRFVWIGRHGGSLASVLTSSSPEPTTELLTQHMLAVGRDGWLYHGDYPWLWAGLDFGIDEPSWGLAASWYVLDTLTRPLYEAWDRLDPGPVISRGLEADATEEEQTAALAVALAKPNVAALDEPDVAVAEIEAEVAKRPRLPRLRLKRIRAILTNHFACEWSMAKGSEHKVYRHGGKLFTFGCHGTDRDVHPGQLKSCLGSLGIPLGDFIAAIE